MGKIRQWRVTRLLLPATLAGGGCICNYTHIAIAFRTGPQRPSAKRARMSRSGRAINPALAAERQWPEETSRERERQVVRLRPEVDKGNVPELTSTATILARKP